MNWSRVRVLLIVCLLIIDGILGLMILYRFRGENTVSGAALDDAVALLSEGGIAIERETVPTAITRDAVYRVPVSENGYRTALSAMVSSPVSGIYLLPSSTGMSVVFENGDRAEYYHNLYLTYTKSGDNPASNDWATLSSDFDETPTAYTACNLRRDAAAREAAETAEIFLAALTYREEDSTVSLRPRTDAVYTTPLDTVYLVELCEELIPGAGNRTASTLYGTHMRVLVEGDCVWYLTGTWVPFLPDAVYDAKKLDQINILFSELKRYTAANASYAETPPAEPDSAITEDAAQTVTSIVEMQSVYYMLWDGAGQLYLRPAWRFLYQTRDRTTFAVTRREILCDGVTGNVVSQTDRPENGNT